MLPPTEVPFSEHVAVLDLHVLEQRVVTATRVIGEVWRVDGQARLTHILTEGDEVAVGQVLYLSPGAIVQAGPLRLEGFSRGRAHSFVDATTVAISPGRGDVPRLLRDLLQLEEQVMRHLGEDPLAMQQTSSTPLERAYAADFAFQNLELDAARTLDERIARASGAVVLFISGESACVAMSEVSVRKLRTLMEALTRPVNPHIVDEDTLRALMAGVYGQLGGGLAS